MQKMIILTGAGMSAESGIKTFIDGGLWEGYDIVEVATNQGFRDNPELVLNCSKIINTFMDKCYSSILL